MGRLAYAVISVDFVTGIFVWGVLCYRKPQYTTFSFFFFAACLRTLKDWKQILTLLSFISQCRLVDNLLSSGPLPDCIRILLPTSVQSWVCSILFGSTWVKFYLNEFWLSYLLISIELWVHIHQTKRGGSAENMLSYVQGFLCLAFVSWSKGDHWDLRGGSCFRSRYLFSQANYLCFNVRELLTMLSVFFVFTEKAAAITIGVASEGTHAVPNVSQ